MMKLVVISRLHKLSDSHESEIDSITSKTSCLSGIWPLFLYNWLGVVFGIYSAQ